MGHPVRNVHRRTIPASPGAVGAVLDTLASPGDLLWPWEEWPPVRFDRPLQPGAAGGHGPIRYTVELYRPGSELRCTFTGPRGVDGWHRFAVTEGDRPGTSELVHELVVVTSGLARLSWPFAFRALHNALIEDALAKAARHFGSTAPPHRAWTPWVRLLRRLPA
ncbi:hypothetical protein [Naasia aerilata]|uniref:SRPBCC family protein n=1 Tax=Naasia aerilata TaxID=1162966 RepID=A0ABN6XT80_9MICO|nr:hypothetical protein [Naasia aerilata]BDZ46830.1 hypothetical protein GCM10025866_27390 [Naasia aerilata]